MYRRRQYTQASWLNILGLGIIAATSVVAFVTPSYWLLMPAALGLKMLVQKRGSV